MRVRRSRILMWGAISVAHALGVNDLTTELLVMAYGCRGECRINRGEDLLLLASYLGYTAYLVVTVTTTPGRSHPSRPSLRKGQPRRLAWTAAWICCTRPPSSPNECARVSR